MTSNTPAQQKTPEVANNAPTAEQLKHFNIKKNEKPDRKELEILIIDDHSFFSSLLSEMLPHGARVKTCDNLGDGWQLYMKMAPDIVFLDIEFPEGQGHALAHKIKTFDADSYIVMVTGNRSKIDIEKAKQNRIDGYIGKPCNQKKISNCVASYVAKRKG